MMAVRRRAILRIILCSYTLLYGCHSGFRDISESSTCEVRNQSGDLTACAAGRPTATGPGVPVDFAGKTEASMPISASEHAAVERANQRTERRRRSAPVDRGFGPSVQRVGGW